MSKLGYRTCHFDPGRAGADQDEGQQTLPQRRVGRGFRLLKGEQQAPTDQSSVVERFEAGARDGQSAWPK